MTAEDDALLATIYADPDDDDARSVYADALLRRGDPRGELIALQLADARGTSSAKDRRRIGALLRAHWPEWGTPLYGAVQIAACRFERGFLARVRVGLAGTTPARIAVMIGHPIWSTVSHVETGSHPPCGELVAHPVMRAVRSLSMFAGDVAAVCAAPAPWRLDILELHALPAELDAALEMLGAHAGCANVRALTLIVAGGGIAASLARISASRFAGVRRLTLRVPQHRGDRDAAIADAVAAFDVDAPFPTLTIGIGHIEVTAIRGQGELVVAIPPPVSSAVYAREYADRFVAAAARFTCTIQD